MVGKVVPKAGPVPKEKSWWVALLLSIFFGFLSLDRFYLGRTKSGIVKIITFAGVGVWYLSDIILIAADYRKDAWLRPLKK